MGTFVFKWTHPANEVFVTGTFDNWTKSQKLNRVHGGFEKEVQLSSAQDKIYYKFVVDGNWVTDHTAPQENDYSGNLNNVLTPDRINSTSLTSAIMSGVTPQSTTAQLAGQVPKDGQDDGHLPGAFPETPALETTNQQQQYDLPPQATSAENYGQHQNSAQQAYAAIPQQQQQQQTFSVNPLPATSGPGNPVVPNESDIVPPSSDFTFNTVQSTVHDDEELKAADLAKQRQPSASGVEYPVAPKPFTELGPQNPVTIAPGEKFPTPDEYALSQKNIHDKEELKAAEIFRNQQQQNVSVNPLPATAGAGNPITLAPGIPVPAPIKAQSVNTNVKLDEASYNKPDAMVGGAPFLPPVVTPQVERENRGTGVFDVPPITQNLIPESSLPMGQSAGAYDAQPFVQSAAPQSTTAQLAGQVPLEKDLKKSQAETVVVPEIVKESQAIAHFPPEASAQKVPVVEKHMVEDELLAKVPKAPVTADGTPSVKEVAGAVGGAITAIGGVAAGYATMAKEKVVGAAPSTQQVKETLPAVPSIEQVKQQLPAVPSVQQVKESLPAPIKNVVAPAPAPTVSHAAPGPVQASIAEAHASPEAAAYREAIADKQQLESELLQKVPTHNETGEPAPNTKPVAIHVDQHKLKDALVEAQHTTDGSADHHTDNQSRSSYGGKGQSEHQEHGASTQAPSTVKQTLAAVPSVEQVKQKLPSLEQVKESLPAPIKNVVAPAPVPTVSHAAPAPVQESISNAHASPEAAAYDEPIQEKSRVEDELLRKVKTENSTGEAAPHISSQQTETSRETGIPASAFQTETRRDETEIPASAYLKNDSQDYQQGQKQSQQANIQQEQPAKNNQTAPVVTDGTQSIRVQAVSSGTGHVDSQPRQEENLNVSEQRENHSRDISPMTRPGERKQATESTDLPDVSSGNGMEPKKNEKGEQVGHFHVEPLPPVQDAHGNEAHAAPEDVQPRRESHALTGGKGVPHNHPAVAGNSAAAGSSTHHDTASAHTTDSAKKDKRRSFFGKLKDKLKN